MIRILRRRSIRIYSKNWADSVRTTTHIIVRGYGSKREIAPAYKPSLVETEYASSVVSQLLNKSDENINGKPYNILLPPPNVTGELHLGHALTCAVQDALVRYAHNKGYRTSWIPGMDHAGIATQVVVEKRLLKERNLTRHDLGKQMFLEEVTRWKIEKEGNIRSTLQKMGCAMEWNREYFTMDPEQSIAVKDAFVHLFDKGLIYRDRSLVNWSCSLESAISDVEVENMEIEGPIALTVPGYERQVSFGRMVDIAYKVQGSTEEIVVSTTRPETFLGDVAVAVHPEDGRYSHLRNKSTFLWHPVRKEEIPLIFDLSVDPSFGTGAVKITPAHDRFDFELGRRHQLATIEVIDERGIVQAHLGPFSGLPRYEARERLINYLSKLSLLRGINPHSMVLPICSRSKDVVELLLRPQWFVRCREMAHRALEAVKTGDLQLIPKSFEQEWFRWLENCHDWCISRQLWWGHRIPAYQVRHGNMCDRWIAARSLVEAKDKYFAKASVSGSIEVPSFEQDCDVLDTWFSSALLPFSTSGWPKTKSTDHYPLQLMETGHDILFFWVARMVMLGQEITDELPFRKVLLHGIMCDEYGRKMSKSLGNVIKPDHVIHGISLDRLQQEAEESYQQGVLSDGELLKTVTGQRKMFPNGIPECGIDALRFTLCSSNVKNHFIHFNVQEAHTNKLFFNKIWQATRYTLGCLERFPSSKTDEQLINRERRKDIPLMDRWILSRLGYAAKQCREGMERYNFHSSTGALKSFFYHNFCDVYLESTKIYMKPAHESHAALQCAVLKHCISVGLHHMEPFTPFLAKELLAHLPISAPYARDDSLVFSWIDVALERKVERMLNICQRIRQSKNGHAPPIVQKHNPIVHLLVKCNELHELLQAQLEIVEHLTHCKGVVLHEEVETFNDQKCAVKSVVSHDCTMGIVANGLESPYPTVDGSRKKLEKLEAEIDKLLTTVNNEGYRKSANKSVQKKHQERLNQLQQQKDEMMKLTA